MRSAIAAFRAFCKYLLFSETTYFHLITAAANSAIAALVHRQKFPKYTSSCSYGTFKTFIEILSSGENLKNNFKKIVKYLTKSFSKILSNFEIFDDKFYPKIFVNKMSIFPKISIRRHHQPPSRYTFPYFPYIYLQE